MIIAASHLDAVTFQICSQSFKIMPTALFAVWLLGQHLAPVQWASLPVLAVGVVFVTMNNSANSSPSDATKLHLMLGLGASALSGLSSAYAGVALLLTTPAIRSFLCISCVHLPGCASWLHGWTCSRVQSLHMLGCVKGLGLGPGLLPAGRVCLRPLVCCGHAPSACNSDQSFGTPRAAWCCSQASGRNSHAPCHTARSPTVKLGLGLELTASVPYVGVYFEKYVKGKLGQTLWVRNLQLSIYGVPLAIAYSIVKDGK